MKRIAPYSGILAALIVGVVLVYFTQSAQVVHMPPPLLSIPQPALEEMTPLILPTNEAIIEGNQEGLRVKEVPQKKINSLPLPDVRPATKNEAAVQTAQEIDSALNASATLLRSALVNIICRAPAHSPFRSISGSGIIIDPKGIILTNAHIAQYYLLHNLNVSCFIRSGSPAVARYEAELLYIPQKWLKENARVLITPNPVGTGERDFALLAITRSKDGVPLPTRFPSTPLAARPPMAGTPVVIASYGAQFIGSSQAKYSLYPTVVFGSVRDVFTYGRNTIDSLALGGSIAAQKGSSGGGVAGADGTLLATITTSTMEGETRMRSLTAITASYIRAVYASDTGMPIDIILNAPTADSVAEFAAKIPQLKAILTVNLSH